MGHHQLTMNLTCVLCARENPHKYQENMQTSFKKNESKYMSSGIFFCEVENLLQTTTTSQSAYEAESNWGTVLLLDCRCRQGAGNADGTLQSVAVWNSMVDCGTNWSKGLNYCIYYTCLSKGPSRHDEFIPKGLNRFRCRSSDPRPLDTYELLCTSHIIWDEKGSVIGVSALCTVVMWHSQREVCW